MHSWYGADAAADVGAAAETSSDASCYLSFSLCKLNISWATLSWSCSCESGPRSPTGLALPVAPGIGAFSDAAISGWIALGASCHGGGPRIVADALVGLAFGLAFGLVALAVLGCTGWSSESSESDELMQVTTPAEAPVPLVASRSSILSRLHDKP